MEYIRVQILTQTLRLQVAPQFCLKESPKLTLSLHSVKKKDKYINIGSYCRFSDTTEDIDFLILSCFFLDKIILSRYHVHDEIQVYRIIIETIEGIIVYFFLNSVMEQQSLNCLNDLSSFIMLISTKGQGYLKTVYYNIVPDIKICRI